jgi:acyl-CoA synthetase (AMP-forming)/AMP-acid ligase II
LTNTLASVLQPAAPDHAAIIIPDGPRVSYQALATEVDRLAGLLAGAGIGRGDSVSIVLPNGLEFMALFMATARAGAVAAPLNSAYTLDEFKFYMEDAAAKVVIVPPGPHPAREAAAALNLPVIEAALGPRAQVTLSKDGASLTRSKDPVAPGPDDVALFLHTSGTTSRPKGVPLRHGNLMASLKNIKMTYGLTPADTTLIAMPLFHVHGLLGAAMSTLNSGGTVVIPPKFSASGFWPVQKATGATWYSAVPTIHQYLLQVADEDGAPHQSFRFIRSCSSALAPVVLEKLEARFGAPVLEAYGMTEASHQMSSNPLPPGRRLPGSVGTGTGVEIAIFEMDRPGEFVQAGQPGEVVIRGPNVMGGYKDNPKANAESFVDGWFRTGDQGMLDGQGYLTLTGRIKELINRGGEKISPLEVDAVLLRHPAVAEAVSFAVPHSTYGECVQAAVVLKGQSDEAALRAFCREHLAKFKVPDRIYIADKLPRTATGKIQRRHVSAAFAGKPG